MGWCSLRLRHHYEETFPFATLKVPLVFNGSIFGFQPKGEGSNPSRDSSFLCKTLDYSL